MVKPGMIEMETEMETETEMEMEMEIRSALTHNAIVAHSASALKVAVPFEFCHRSV